MPTPKDQNSNFLSVILRFWTDRANDHSAHQPLASDILWSIIGAIVSRGMIMLSTVYCARLLSKEDFGAFGLAQGAAIAFQGFLYFGLHLTTNKYIAEWKHKEPIRAQKLIALAAIISLTIGLSLCIIIVAFSSWYCHDILMDSKLIAPFKVSGLIILAGALLGVLNGSQAGLGAFRSQARVNMIAGSIQLILVPIGAYWGGTLGAMCGVLLGTLSNTLLSLLDLKREAESAGIKLALAGLMDEWRVLCNFSLPATLTSAIMAPVVWLGYSFVAQMDNGLASVALITIAMQWQALVLFIPQKVGPIFTAQMSRCIITNSKDGFLRTQLMAFASNGVVSLLIVIPLVIASPWIMSIYGTLYAGDHGAYCLIVACGFLISIDFALNRSLAALNLMWASFAASLFWSGMFTLLTYCLVPWDHAMGFAIALLAAYLLRMFIESLVLLASLRSMWNTTGFLPETKEHDRNITP